MPEIYKRPASWMAEIEGCFGSADGKFAIHRLDADRALALLARLRTERVGWSFVEPAVRDYLRKDGCKEDHIAKRLIRVKNHFKPWLVE